MGELNWNKGIAGFGKGMLTGYQNVMEMKMKEDFMNRMEEARLIRDKNMAQWKNETIDTPAREQQQKFELDKQQAGFTHSETLQRESLAHSERMTNAQISAANARAAEDRKERRQERLDNKIVGVMEGTGLPVTRGDLEGMDSTLRTKVVSPETYQLSLLEKKSDQEFKTSLNNTAKLADMEYQRALESTGDQAQALARKVFVQKSGVQNQSELAKYENATDPERNKGYYAAIQDGIKEGNKVLEMYPETSQRREVALKAGLDKQSAADPVKVDSFILEQYGARSGQAFLQSYLNNTGKGRGGGNNQSNINFDPQTSNLSDQAAKKIAQDLKWADPSKQEDAVSLYRNLSAESKAKVDAYRKQVTLANPYQTYNPAGLSEAQRNYSDKYKGGGQ